MNQQEELLAMIFNIYFKKIGLTQNLVSQLEDILKLQFQKDVLCEIVGSAFSQSIGNRKELLLEVIRPQKMQEVELALLCFRQKDYSQVGVLYDFAQRTRDAQEKHYGKNLSLQAVCEFLDIVVNKPEKLKSLTPAGREFWFENYKQLLRSSSEYYFREMGVDKKGFIGTFHCHDSGSPPSKIDLEQNVVFGIPELVISATSDYQEKGVKLYLVHSGSVEILYEGLLKPKDKPV